MKIPPRIRQQLKGNRALFAGLSAALLFFTAAYYLVLRGRSLDPTVINNQILLFVLLYINVVLVLAILFVLLRNLFKLWVERQSRILGAKFKTKLVATYIGLSLIPVLLLFVYATELLQGSIENLFRTPTEQLLGPGNDVAQALTSEIQEANRRDATRLLREILPLDLQDPSQQPELDETLKRLLPELRAELLAVYEDTEFVHAALDPKLGDFPDVGRNFLVEVVRDGAAVRIVELPGRPERLLLAGTANTPSDAGVRTVAVAGRILGAELASHSAALVEAYQTGRQLEVQEPQIKATYLLLFLMVTLVILLTSSWMGLYLARRVTVPIQALAEGTRRIMGGDLQHRVEAAADDELGVLVDSFNRMTKALEQNERLLEASNDELKATNQRLAEERARIATVVDNLAAGVVAVDADGHILAANNTALQMLALRPTVIGRPLREVWQDPDRAPLLGLFEEGQDEGRTVRREVRLAIGSEWKTFEVKTTAMPERDGRPGGHVIVLEDLTELIKAQKLATWSEAARRIAHEIKNPLTPIRLSAERLLMKYKKGDPELGPAIEKGVEIIAREVRTMQLMVDEFSRFARMPRPQPATVDLGRLVDETAELFRDIKPGVAIATRFGNKETLLDAKIDGEQIKSALINLIDNAIAATPAPGEIIIGAERDNGQLRISVADSGEGIPAEAKEKLFLPYYSTKGRGTGLGLAIVHRIVTDHHGTIRVEDNRPRGTVFTLEVPQI